MGNEAYDVVCGTNYDTWPICSEIYSSWKKSMSPCTGRCICTLVFILYLGYLTQPYELGLIFIYPHELGKRHLRWNRFRLASVCVDRAVHCYIKFMSVSYLLSFRVRQVWLIYADILNIRRLWLLLYIILCDRYG